ncbi:MAG: TIGR01620 family protein [Pikeienuella sp.]
MSDRPHRPNRPVILDPEETPGADPQGVSPADAPPVPDLAEPASATGASAERMLRQAARGTGTSWIGRLIWSGVGGLVILGVGLWLGGFVADLFALAPWLGWLGTAFLVALAVGLLALVLRELAALARLGRVEGLQRLAATARATESPIPGRKLAADLAALYHSRPELAAADMVARAAEMSDGPDIVAMAERRLMPSLDIQAERAASRAASRVAGVTALLPMPAIDLLVVLAENIRMIRSIAEIYGGRAGWLGSWRLLRAVAQHLAATGAISVTDDLLGPLVGGGLLGQISRRFGEAAVNAALTARVGTAAIEVCRPLPFAARPAPKARNIVLGVLNKWRPSERPSPAASGG